MTDKTTDAAIPETQPVAETPAGDQTAAGSITSNKAFWAGIGIGSAALVAALMYTQRPKKRK